MPQITIFLCALLLLASCSDAEELSGPDKTEIDSEKAATLYKQNNLGLHTAIGYQQDVAKRFYNEVHRLKQKRMRSRLEKAEGGVLVCQYKASDYSLLYTYVYWHGPEKIRTDFEKYPVNPLTGLPHKSTSTCPDTLEEAKKSGYPYRPGTVAANRSQLLRHGNISSTDLEVRKRIEADIAELETQDNRILACDYNDPEDEERTRTYLFWYQQGPLNAGEEYKKIAYDHPILTEIGQAMERCPANLKKAILAFESSTVGGTVYSAYEESLFSDGGELIVPEDYDEPGAEDIKLAVAREFMRKNGARWVDRNTVHYVTPSGVRLFLNLAGVNADYLGQYERFVEVDKESCNESDRNNRMYTCTYKVYTETFADENRKEYVNSMRDVATALTRERKLAAPAEAMFDAEEALVNETFSACFKYTNDFELTNNGWKSPSERERLKRLEVAGIDQDDYRYMETYCNRYPPLAGVSESECDGLRERFNRNLPEKMPLGERCD